MKNPKLLMARVNDEFSDESLISLICAKDKVLYDERKKGALFKVHHSWKSRNNENINSRNVIIECSKDIRNRIINLNNGYIYFGLSRYKVKDYVSPKQCFHCQRFNHVAANCEEKEKPQVCGLCAMEHDTRNCPSARGRYRKCINCPRTGGDDCDPYHSARSASCPIFLRTKESILRRLCFDYNDD